MSRDDTRYDGENPKRKNFVVSCLFFGNEISGKFYRDSIITQNILKVKCFFISCESSARVCDLSKMKRLVLFRLHSNMAKLTKNKTIFLDSKLYNYSFIQFYIHSLFSEKKCKKPK